jgi:hypothetical protein
MATGAVPIWGLAIAPAFDASFTAASWRGRYARGAGIFVRGFAAGGVRETPREELCSPTCPKTVFCPEMARIIIPAKIHSKYLRIILAPPPESSLVFPGVLLQNTYPPLTMRKD